MADGFSRASGRHGVCIAQNGPGITNFVTAVAAAYWAHSPVVVITPETGSNTQGLGGFQETEQLPFFEKITKYQVHCPQQARMAELLSRCFDYALLERGPAQFNIPRDLFYGEADYAIPAPIRVERGPGGPESLAAATELLAGAKFPVILSGGGIVMSGGVPEVVRLAEQLGARLGLPVHVENESNLAALAEHWTGAAVGIDDFICVFGEVGVGGGVVLGGRLFRGSHGFGGEFGHIPVDPQGHACACGSLGCVETLVGQESIARAAGISHTTGGSRSLTDELVRRAEDGSPELLRALADAGRWLGIALAATFNVLDLQAVVLGGCFGPLAPWLIDDVGQTLEERSLAARSGTFAVLPSAFGDGAAVRGAAALSLHRVLDEPWMLAGTRDVSQHAGQTSASGVERRGEEVLIGRP
jgi:predicted NBD/HSP70 family sugar kinase